MIVQQMAEIAVPEILLPLLNKIFQTAVLFHFNIHSPHANVAVFIEVEKKEHNKEGCLLQAFYFHARYINLQMVSCGFPDKCRDSCFPGRDFQIILEKKVYFFLRGYTK